MFLLKRIRNWLLRKKSPPNLVDANIGAATARDIGVKITRVRLPSGGEVVIVERVMSDD